MKILAKYGWVDIAIRVEKQLLILVCDTPEHAKQLFEFLKWKSYNFTYKPETDRFHLKLWAYRYGHYYVAITPEHPGFRFTNDLTKKVFKFTTGALLPNGKLGYLKDTLPIKNTSPSSFGYPLIKPPYKPYYPIAVGPDMLINSIKKILRIFR